MSWDDTANHPAWTRIGWLLTCAGITAITVGQAMRGDQARDTNEPYPP